MDFSFIMPSRGNWKDLKNTLDSFERTTSKKNQVEVLIVLDEGTGKDIPKLIKDQDYGFYIGCFYRPHSEWWSKDYFNFLADRSVGDNICAFNDDAWIKTRGWDNKLRKIIKDSGWSVYLLDIPDSARIKYGHTFPCFPMISRKGFIEVGYFFNPQVKVYPLDRILHGVYKNVDRIIQVDNVFIQHDHIKETDPSKSRLMQIFIEQRDKGELKLDVSLEVMSLLKLANKDYCKGKNKLTKILEILKGE